MSALFFLDFATAGRYGGLFAWLTGAWVTGWVALAMHHAWSRCPLCGGLFYVGSVVWQNPLGRRCQGCALELFPPGGVHAVNAAELAPLVAALADLQLEGAGDAFELSKSLVPFTRRNRTLDERQARLLEAIQRIRPPVFLAPPEDPLGVPGTWTAEGKGTWRLPTDVSAERLLEELLDAGNWILYAGPAAVAEPLPDAHHVPASTVRAFMHRHSLWLLLDAWHDGTSWRVFLSGR